MRASAGLGGFAIGLACLAAGGGSATAACPTITFDNLAAGTRVTTQYDGVTFSGRNAGGGLSVQPVIFNPNGSTSSEPQCLSAYGDGISEFSNEYLRLQFDHDQTEVTFTVGVRVGCLASDTVQVRWYDSSAVLRGTSNIPVNGTTSERCLVFVRVERAAGFRRVEIEAGAGGVCASRFELIDDLAFDLDTTPPTAEITSPAQLACVCNGTSVIGSAYDPDGPITVWRLERKALGAIAWTLIRTSSTEVINGELGPWTTVAADGWYTLRLTITNACGLTDVWTTDVYLNKAFNSLALRSPAKGAILGGSVCADGSAWDHCGGSFTLEHRPAGAGAWVPFDSVNPPWITNDPLGSWNTRAGTPDGDYEIRLIGTDECGNTASEQVTVTVDNTPPTAVITSPLPCRYLGGVIEVRGTANDTHLAGWVLQYAGDDAHGWITIAAGNGAVVNGLLALWDTTLLRPCAYSLRLVVTDQAMLDCNGSARNQSEYIVSVNVGSRFDGDGDGDVDQADFGLFQDCHSGPDIPADPNCPN